MSALHFQEMDLLIVDDDDDAASFIKYVLEDEGFKPRLASNLEQARARLKEALPDLLVLDRRLPDGDGLKFCEELRADPATARVPILFLSALKEPSEVLEGFDAGGDDYLTKPFRFLELVARVQALLRRTTPSRASAA